MNEMGYLALGFGLIWLILAGYLVWIGRAQTLLGRRLERLAAEDRAEGPTSGGGGTGDEVDGLADF